ncbi:HNH endonuclease [Antarctobacter heliothermus]|uniref:HNH endonuclease n=1 Tax=Antarctobacter heliothermus TaxID=74033 RepID=A0A222E7Q6_9RHOB|nr:HNH endonuclease signature motif containing protein [Antarctobacter heliothermus]ASP22058.1 HNH endonuclease [Antarctobacter heliothermus]
MTRKQDRSTIDTARWARVRHGVAERAAFRCETCGRFVGLHGQADHIVPRRRCEEQGIDPFDLANLQWLCAGCHSKKTNAERWEGRTRKDRTAVRRAKVTGRGAYLSALLNGGAS